MSKYTLNIVNKDGNAEVRPSFIQKLRGVNHVALLDNPITLAVEIPESIAKDFAYKVFGIVTHGRPVEIRITTPRACSFKGGPLV